MFFFLSNLLPRQSSSQLNGAVSSLVPNVLWLWLHHQLHEYASNCFSNGYINVTSEMSHTACLQMTAQSMEHDTVPREHFRDTNENSYKMTTATIKPGELPHSQRSSPLFSQGEANQAVLPGPVSQVLQPCNPLYPH